MAAASLALFGCVDQHPYRSAAQAQGEEYVARIAATSVTIVQICERLDLDLMGVPETSSQLPERYGEAVQVGLPMSPDLEVIRSLHLDYVLSPSSLKSDLQVQYAGINQACIFLDLASVGGLFDSLDYLGRKFGREEQACAEANAYEATLNELEAQRAGKPAPRVLILMGVPGSYVVATEHSYAGNLASLAGAENVYAGESEEAFINVGTEDMLARNPEVILRTAHAMPDEVREMFAKEFSENDIWKHFSAVQEGRVYDLDASLFGMSATFDYAEALASLAPLLYGEGEAVGSW